MDCGVDELIFDLTSVLCFIVKEGYLYAFIHKSIPEYFAAEFIKSHGNPEGLYKDIDDNYDKYKNVCTYLNEIDEYSYYIYFFKDAITTSYKVFLKKDFLDRIYFVKVNNVIKLRIIFDESIHECFAIDLRDKLRPIIKEDINRSFKGIKGVELTISKRARNDAMVAQVCHDGEGVENSYYDSVIEESATYSRHSAKDLEVELETKGYKKINSAVNKGKFHKILVFLNTYVSEMSIQILKVETIINRHKKDDYSF